MARIYKIFIIFRKWSETTSQNYDGAHIRSPSIAYTWILGRHVTKFLQSKKIVVFVVSLGFLPFRGLWSRSKFLVLSVFAGLTTRFAWKWILYNARDTPMLNTKWQYSLIWMTLRRVSYVKIFHNKLVSWIKVSYLTLDILLCKATLVPGPLYFFLNPTLSRVKLTNFHSNCLLSAGFRKVSPFIQASWLIQRPFHDNTCFRQIRRTGNSQNQDHGYHNTMYS